MFILYLECRITGEGRAFYVVVKSIHKKERFNQIQRRIFSHIKNNQAHASACKLHMRPKAQGPLSRIWVLRPPTRRPPINAHNMTTARNIVHPALRVPIIIIATAIYELCISILRTRLGLDIF